MNINNLKAFLNKNSIPFNTFKTGTDYFTIFDQSAPAVFYEAISIEIIHQDIKELNKTLNTIEKYCNRYKFDIFNRGRLSCDIYNKYHYFIAIRTPEATAAINNYCIYSNKLKNDFELLQHFYHVNNIMESHRDQFKKEYMQFYKKYIALYLESLNQEKTA